MSDPAGDEIAPVEKTDAVAPRLADEIAELERQVADAHRLLDPPVPVAQTAANVTIGAADELGRLILSFVVITALLIGLAVLVTPWVWIGVGIWIALAVWTIAHFSRRRNSRSPGTPSIEQ